MQGDVIAFFGQAFGQGLADSNRPPGNDRRGRRLFADLFYRFSDLTLGRPGSTRVLCRLLAVSLLAGDQPLRFGPVYHDSIVGCHTDHHRDVAGSNIS